MRATADGPGPVAFEFLTSGPTYTLDGDTLTLTSGDLVITLVDREIAVPDQPLTNITWD